MNELTSMLSTTGLIATLISVLFAVASLIIANRRKKHHLAMQHAMQHAAGVPPQNMPPAQPEAPMTFTAPQPTALSTPPAAAEAESLAYDTRPTSSPLFKRLGRVGVEKVSPGASAVQTPNDQKMSWE